MPPSVSTDIHDRLSKSEGCFLRQIVPNPAVDIPVRISARKFFGIGARVRMRRTIGILFEGYAGHRNVGTCGKSIFQLVILRFAIGQTDPPAIIVNDNVDILCLGKFYTVDVVSARDDALHMARRP